MGGEARNARVGVRAAVVIVGALVLGACASAGGPRPEDAQAVDSVGVGYGTTARRDVAGAVQSIVIPDSVRSRYARVEDMLVGRVPGLQLIPNADGTIALRLRGTTSLDGNNEPLIIVDGMPASGYGEANVLAGISPVEVARIDVLKDGEAAIYGSRGAAGVIIITTLRGRAGSR